MDLKFKKKSCNHKCPPVSDLYWNLGSLNGKLLIYCRLYLWLIRSPPIPPRPRHLSGIYQLIGFNQTRDCLISYVPRVTFIGQKNYLYVNNIILLFIACSRHSDSGGTTRKDEEWRVDNRRGDWGRMNACKHFFKKLVPVYQILVYPLIGQFWQILSTLAHSWSAIWRRREIFRRVAHAEFEIIV